MPGLIQLDCDLAEVARLNRWLKARFEESATAEALANDIKLCLNEAVTNTISYGFDDPADAEIVVELDFADDTAVATLVDNGVAFNPLDIPETAKIESLETAKIGGFGVKLMRERASALAYERTGGRNRLTMHFS